MKHLLITGFDPFGGETVNPSWEAVSRLPDMLGNYRLTKMQIPTVFAVAAETVLTAAAQDAPDVILCVGQAGGRDAVTPERIAVNMASAKKPDNAGNQPVEMPILPGKISNTAGTFVCNDTLFRLLHHFSGTSVRVGFIHVPWLPEQAKEAAPSMALGDIIAALTAAIGVLG